MNFDRWIVPLRQKHEVCGMATKLTDEAYLCRFIYMKESIHQPRIWFLPERIRGEVSRAPTVDYAAPRRIDSLVFACGAVRKT